MWTSENILKNFESEKLIESDEETAVPIQRQFRYFYTSDRY